MIYIHETGLCFKKYKKTYHLLADSTEELHSFANKIGLKLSWFQYKSTLPHYDIFGTMLTKALKNGAVLIDNQQIIKLIKLHKNKI